MGTIKYIAATLAAAALATSVSALASSQRINDTQNAEQLRRLDIMLMVTDLQCRGRGEGFSADYDRFAANHRPTMNSAGRRLRAAYAAGRSERAQRRMLDTISTSMANQYGLGHPWLSCTELRDVTVRLADTRDVSVLLAAADEFLAPRPPVRVSMDASYLND